MARELEVCWISAGVSSFIAGWLERQNVDIYIYISIDDQHPDSMRFIHDCEKALGKEIVVLQSNQYRCVNDAILAAGMFRNPFNMFYPCTNWLKKRVRKEWEAEHKDCDITYVWGMDCSEKNRADRLNESMPDFKHKFPLIENGLSKARILERC